MFFRKPSDHVPHVTIFHTILRSMLWILFIEIALLVGILYLCRINTSLEQNAVDILQIQTENRQNYLQGQMLDAQDLSSLAGKINAVTQAMLDDGEISLDTLDSGSDAASPLLLSIRHRHFCRAQHARSRHTQKGRAAALPLSARP